MEFAVLWRRRRLVPQLSLLRKVRQSGVLPRCIAAPAPARRVQAKGCALSRHPPGRTDRRSPACELGEAGQPIARRTHVRDDDMKKAVVKKSTVKEAGESPARLIDATIKRHGDWRGETLARVRALIKEADPQVVEEVKWRKPSNGMLGVPVWEHYGIICTGETYKGYVKLTFAKGAALDDPTGLFNASLDGNVRRAIDIHEGAKINEKAFKALVRAAVALNTSAADPAVRSRKKSKP